MWSHQQVLVALVRVSVYTTDQLRTTVLLALYKKIVSHWTAAIFCKPVNPLEGENYMHPLL